MPYKASLENKFDGVICSGDIVHDVNPQFLDKAYQIFVELINKYFPDTPIYLVPGNHDNLELFAQMRFNAPQVIVSEKEVVPVVLNQTWHLLLVNSKACKRVGGSISPEQSKYIAHYLEQNSRAKVALVMHHNPLPASSAWLDSHRFTGIEEFWQEVASYPNLELVLHGHIHQDLTLNTGKTAILSVPSTSVQFKPRQEDFTLDTIAPGYRILTLSPDGFSQELKRLETRLVYEQITGY
ncbi:metallophosphoesterase [Psittacicella hinzii]|nr:metallophosphoesterase [Psittacicella hinzii]